MLVLLLVPLRTYEFQPPTADVFLRTCDDVRPHLPVLSLFILLASSLLFFDAKALNLTFGLDLLRFLHHLGKIGLESMVDKALTKNAFLD